MTGPESIKAYFDNKKMDVIISPAGESPLEFKYLVTLRELDRLKEFDLSIYGIFDPEDYDGDEHKNAPGSYIIEIHPDFIVCRECGCSNANACGEGCWWVEENLCSACEEKLQEAES